MSLGVQQLVPWREKHLRRSAFRCELRTPCGRLRVVVCVLCYCAGPGGPLFVCLNFLFELRWLWLGVTSPFSSLAVACYSGRGVALCLG